MCLFVSFEKQIFDGATYCTPLGHFRLRPKQLHDWKFAVFTKHARRNKHFTEISSKVALVTAPNCTWTIPCLLNLVFCLSGWVVIHPQTRLIWHTYLALCNQNMSSSTNIKHLCMPISVFFCWTGGKGGSEPLCFWLIKYVNST